MFRKFPTGIAGQGPGNPGGRVTVSTTETGAVSSTSSQASAAVISTLGSMPILRRTDSATRWIASSLGVPSKNFSQLWAFGLFYVRQIALQNVNPPVGCPRGSKDIEFVFPVIKSRHYARSLFLYRRLVVTYSARGS